MLKRLYDESLVEKLKTNKILLIKGPRNANKSNYLANLMIKESNQFLKV
jgi:predicted AAA+ superfamily ATPase